MPHEGSLLQTAVIAPDTSHGDSLAHLITSKS